MSRVRCSQGLVLLLALAVGLPTSAWAGKHCPKVACIDGAPPKKFALIIDGHNTLDFNPNSVGLYDILKGLGYEITFLTPRFQEAGYKGKANGTTTLPAIKAEFEALGAKARCCDDVVIAFFAHGWSGLAVFPPDKAAEEAKKWNPDKDPGKWHPSLSLNPYEKSKTSGKEAGDKKGGSLTYNKLAKWLDLIKSCDVKVYINSCYSGSFQGLKNPKRRDNCYCRTVYTSSKPELVSYGPSSFISGYGEVPNKKGDPTSFHGVFVKAVNNQKNKVKKLEERTGKKLRILDTPQIYEGDIVLCVDSDGDNLCDGLESFYGTDPQVADSDGDGVSDGQEVSDGTKPLIRDSDGDKLSDGEEKKMGTNPNKQDTDGDGLNDKQEMFAGTNPLNSDTDGDGFSDGEELLRLHTNPLSANTPAKKKTAGLIPSDVESTVAVIPSGPMVEAYIAMAVDAHDRFRDLDAAHDWLERALELDPDNYVAKGILERVKAEEQQVGLQRAGVILGALQQMLAEQARREQEQQEQQEHEEYRESHPGAEHHPGGGESPPVEEWHPPPKEDY